MIDKIRQTVCVLLLNTKIEIKAPTPRPQPKMTEAKVYDPTQKPQTNEVQKTVKNVGKKVGRNDPCPCGSGKKYKNCCGRGE